jgi:CheY-like chemotaxis protein
MEHARILVVEDEELVAIAIKKCLEGFGYEVPCVVASGEEAVKKTAALEADLVLMDINLQGEMNGIDAAALTKDSTRVPVIYLTAYSDADTLERAKVTEPYGFILKPFEERALEATVKMALSRSHAQKELVGTHDKLSAILHSVGDGIVVMTPFVSARGREAEAASGPGGSHIRFRLLIPFELSSSNHFQSFCGFFGRFLSWVCARHAQTFAQSRNLRII